MAETAPDISQLNETQQEALQTYTSVTDSDPIVAIPILQRAEWNVQIAIARFFDGEPTTDPVAEARAALPAAAARQTTNLAYDSFAADIASRSPRRSLADSVERIDVGANGEIHYQSPSLLSTLFTPFRILYRIFATLFSPFSFLLPGFIPRLFARLALTPTRPTRRSLAPADNARRFIREFEEQYGDSTVPFVESGFNLALDNAKKDLKFLVVVLLSPNHDDNDSWVRETLLSSQFKNFISSHQANTVLWGGNVQDSEAYQVSDQLRCTKFPFVALICKNTDAGSSGSAMTTVLRVAGPTTASELVAKLSTAMASHEAQLAASRAQQAEQNASQNLRREQDSAYERSLAQDRERARLRREEQEAQAQAEKAALLRQQAAEQKAANVIQWKRWRAQSLPNEPPTNVKDVIRVSIRLSSGERVIRRFHGDADLEELYAYVECHDVFNGEKEEKDTEVEEPIGYTHEYGFQLVSPMPRTVYALDKGGSIAERVGRGANLIVEPLEIDESDTEDT